MRGRALAGKEKVKGNRDHPVVTDLGIVGKGNLKIKGNRDHRAVRGLGEERKLKENGQERK